MSKEFCNRWFPLSGEALSRVYLHLSVPFILHLLLILATDKTDDEDKNRVFVKRVYYHSCVTFSRGQICRATPSHLKKKGEHFAKESLIGVFLERISFLCFHYREFHFSSIFFITDIDFGSIDCFIDCCNFVS